MDSSNASGSAQQNENAIALDIPIVGQMLGGSFIYEEHKGDFESARKIAEAALDNAAADADIEKARLALGVVRLLQGELIEAQSILAKVETSADSSSDARVLAFTCAHMAQMYQYRTAPSGGIFTQEI